MSWTVPRPNIVPRIAMNSDKNNDPTPGVKESNGAAEANDGAEASSASASGRPTEERVQEPAQKSGWRGVLAKVLPSKKAAKDKPSPNIYPLF